MLTPVSHLFLPAGIVVVVFAVVYVVARNRGVLPVVAGAAVVIASGMGPLRPGERFHSATGPMTCTGGWPAAAPLGC